MTDQKRRLAAIMSADAVGYSRLMGLDDQATVAALEAARDVFRDRIAAHSGRVVDTAGDSVLAEFDSGVAAVQCAIEVQEGLADRNRDVTADRRLLFRIGLNLGDIIAKDDGSIYGDGVNIAARLEALAEPGGICMSGTVRDLAAGRLGLDTDDLGEQQVKNIATPVKAYRLRGLEAAGGQPDNGPADMAGRPSIAVLPFDNLSGDPEQEFFADGIAEDIITELSKLRSLLVIARNSSFAYKGQAGRIDHVAKELGARFIVHGSVRKGGNRARISVQLVDAESDAQLWAERYDRELDDVFAVQDEITQKIVGILPSRIEAADLERAHAKPVENLAAYEYLLRGKYHHHKGTKEDNARALEMLDKAIELDPGHAESYAWRACTLGQALMRKYKPPSETYDRLVADLDTSLRLDEDDFECHRILSDLHLFRREYDRAEFHAQRAYDLNPNDPLIISQLGEYLTWTGMPEAAIEKLEQALRVDPHRPDGRLSHLATAQFVAGRYDDAITTLNRIANLEARHHSYLAAGHAALGDMDAAARHAAEVRRLDPEFSAEGFVKRLPYKAEPDRNRHLDALRKAGLDNA